VNALEFDWKKPTVQMLGRWQPWHPGHQALFERALAKTGQVAIMVRDTGGTDDSNPFDFEFVKSKIEEALLPKYAGKFIVVLVPNIVNITYGRGVGYAIEQEFLGADVESISATKIRQAMEINNASTNR
jgi:ATP sulfurylase